MPFSIENPTNIRTRGLFAPPEGLVGNQPIPSSAPAMPDRDTDPIGMINQLYQPERQVQDEYMQHLRNMPTRNNPSTLRRIGAIFSGTPERADRFLHAPYYNQLADWEMRGKALEPAMQAERYTNANERQLAGNLLTWNAANRRADIAEMNAQNKAKTDAEKLKIARHRAETYRYSREHPNMELQETSDGSLVAINPQNKEVSYIKDPETGENIKVDTLSDEEKIQLQIRGRLQAIGAQGAENRRTNVQEHQQRLEQIEAQGEQSRETKATPADAGSTKETTTTTTVTGPDGTPVGTRIVKGTTKTIPGQQEMVLMRTPNGRLVRVPKNKVKEAESKGGKVVK